MVTTDEVVFALSTISSDKAPGPDGFFAHFFKDCWKIVGDDVVNAIFRFFKTGKLLGEVNSTLVSLVPKTDGASRMTDFRPISCCNVIYKCITKILTLRMKNVISHLVSPFQSAFISGRAIQDNILLAH